MKKVLLSAPLFLSLSFAGFAQNIGKTLNQEQALIQKNVLNSSVAGSEGFFNTRAEGDIIWSNDFSNASNWSMTNTSVPPHGWNIITNLNAAPVSAFVPLNFPTGSNGFAFVNSDEAGTAQNPSQTNAIIRWNGTPIDCSQFPNVSIKFNSATRNWSSQYFLQVSSDGGQNWTEIPILQNITTNVNSANSEVVMLNISSLTNQSSQVMIGFRYQANWGWFWAIDDVELFETWNYDLTMVEAISSMGELGLKYTIYPVGQVTSNLRMGFGADVKNNGAMAMTPALKATQGANWTFTGTPVTSNPNQLTTDSVFIAAANGYPIPSTAGTYNITLELSTAQTLQNQAAATRTMPFAVSPLVMASDTYNGTAASISGGFFGWATATGDPGIGLEFELNNAASVGRVAVGIPNINTQSQGNYIGRELYVELWKVQNGELVFAGISEPHVITASNFGNLVQCYFETPIAFQAGESVVAIAASGEFDLVPVAFAGMHLAGNTIGKAGSTFVTLASDGPYVSTPVVRLDFGNYTGIKNNTLVSQDVVVFPNPAKENAQIQYTLTEEASVSIAVRDLSGKLVFSTERGLVGAGTYTSNIDMNNFAQGMYTVTISANGAQVTQKLMKN
jgi:hypothetical protein